jgi:predicted nucleic acid-binding protein
MPLSIRIRHRVADAQGLIDTSVLVDLDGIPIEQLPDEMAIAAISLAELAAGPHATEDPAERARRQDRLQRVEATFEPLPFDASAARAYGQIYAAVAVAGRKPRGRRAVDLLIAATALGAGLPLWTRNPADFEGLEGLIRVVAV